MSTTLTLAAGGVSNPLDKAIDYWFIGTEGGWWLWSAHIGNLVLTAVLMVLLGRYVARRIATGPSGLGAGAYVPRGLFPHTIEVICTYLRREVVEPQLHEKTEKYMPFLWTLFFFILINNLLGLIPIAQFIWFVSGMVNLATEGAFYSKWYKDHVSPMGGTATGNLFVNAALAVCAAIVFNVGAIKAIGLKGYLAHMTGGAPFPVNIVVFVIEFVGNLFIKPAALTVRLFANMTAGALIIATFYLFIELAGSGLSFLGWGPVSVVSVVAAVAITLLKIFVSFLQAFVFMFLTTIFLGMLATHGDHEHGEGHGHEHAHA
jgi:F-type H+-transporting ATPase subunit a